ncbi:MAG: MFS transporter [Oscillospiraceae bacterium]|nr:MFS transporter [Oscillospiraceae bacterium]
MKTKTQKHPGWRTTKGQRTWYFMGRIGCYNLQALVPGFMNLFLIFNGVDLAMVAAITLIVRIIDVADDVIFGYLVDKIDLTKIKFLDKLRGEGRYLPWMRCFMYLFPFAILLFFLLPAGLSNGMKLVWFAVTYLLFDLTYTLVDVPIQSTLQTLSDVPEERNHLVTVGYVVVTVAAISTNLIQQVLISESVGLSVRTMAIGSLIVFSMMMLPMPFKMKEYNAELHNSAAEQEKTYTVGEMFRVVRSNKPYLTMIVSQLIPALLATGTGVSLFVSYYLYGSSTAMLLPSTVGMVLAVIFQMAAPKLSKKFGNKKPLVAACAVMTLFSFGIFFAGYQNFGIVVAFTLINAGLAGLVTMLRSYIFMQAIDYAKYVNGRDTTGIFNAINTFVGKITNSVASSLGLFLLSLFGWQSVTAESFADLAAQGVEQSAAALNGLWTINALIPAIGALLGLIVICAYKLTDEDARLMGLCNLGQITREECEAQLSRKY